MRLAMAHRAEQLWVLHCRFSALLNWLNASTASKSSRAYDLNSCDNRPHAGVKALGVDWLQNILHDVSSFGSMNSNTSTC